MKHGVDAANSICEICSFSTDGQYPDFTKLYNHVNNLLFEKVISQIPTEIWTYILEYVCKSSRSYKYSHQWVRWTLVSHKFRDIVYSMKDIFFSPIKQTGMGMLVLEKFCKLKILRITCTNSTLILPFLKHLTKIKHYIDHDDRSISHQSKYHVPRFPCLNPELLPNLTSLSCSQSCNRDQIYTLLMHLNTDIKKKITKLRIALPVQYDTMINTLQQYPYLRILKIDDILLGGRWGSYKSFCPLLEEIHVIGENGIPLDFTGKARVYTMTRTLMENDKDAVFFSVGQVEKGKKIGEWKFYNLDKIFLYASDNSMVSRFNYTAFKSYMRPLKMVD